MENIVRPTRYQISRDEKTKNEKSDRISIDFDEQVSIKESFQMWIAKERTRKLNLFVQF